MCIHIHIHVRHTVTSLFDNIILSSCKDTCMYIYTYTYYRCLLTHILSEGDGITLMVPIDLYFKDGSQDWYASEVFKSLYCPHILVG